MKNDIRLEIAKRRAVDVKRFGPAQGLRLPSGRNNPLIPFLMEPHVICEVKRRSPSAGDIEAGIDPVSRAGSYIGSGIRNISVLTEQNYFGGSLEDLVRIKNAFPDTAILRKDFLLCTEDVEVSYQAGADAFLLIASLLDVRLLKRMYDKGIELGMTPLVELHSPEDVVKARSFRPNLVGINSRDLRSFTIRPLQPLFIRSMIDWDCRVIYESGIKTVEDADFAAGTGFDGILVGEAAVRDRGFASELAAVFSREPARHRYSFWKRLGERGRLNRPLVKICGITRREDLLEARRLGADIAGFILADSPRRTTAGFVEDCRDIDILKVGVVVLKEGETLPKEVASLLETGALDAIQFHGDEEPELYLGFPGYKAVRVGCRKDADEAGSLPGPAVLIDAFDRSARGGTGRRVDSELVRRVSKKKSLWLAGGIDPDNVFEIITGLRPELIDSASGTEAEAGIKDHGKLRRLFGEIERSAGILWEANDERIQ